MKGRRLLSALLFSFSVSALSAQIPQYLVGYGNGTFTYSLSQSVQTGANSFVSVGNLKTPGTTSSATYSIDSLSVNINPLVAADQLGLIIKTDTTGALIWARDLEPDFTSTTNFIVSANAAVSAGDGTVIIGGSISDGSDLLGQTETTNSGSQDAFVMKLDASGNVLWRKVFGGSGMDAVNALGLRSDGQIVVGGIFNSALTLGSTTLTPADNSPDGFLALLQSDGSTFNSASDFGGTGYQDISKLIVTEGDTVWTASRTQNDLLIDGNSANSIGSSDAAVVISKISDQGTFLSASAIDMVNSSGVDTTIEFGGFKESSNGQIWLLVNSYFDQTTFNGTTGNKPLIGPYPLAAIFNSNNTALNGFSASGSAGVWFRGLGATGTLNNRMFVHISYRNQLTINSQIFNNSGYHAILGNFQSDGTLVNYLEGTQLLYHSDFISVGSSTYFTTSTGFSSSAVDTLTPGGNFDFLMAKFGPNSPPVITATSDTVGACAGSSQIQFNFNVTDQQQNSFGFVINSSATSILDLSNYDVQPTGNPHEYQATIALIDNSPNTATLRVIANDGIDTTGKSFTVVISNSPTVSGGADVTVCAGDSVTLSGSGTATSFTWSDGVTNGQPFLPSSSGSFVVTGTATGGCSSTDTVMVNINPLPDVSAGADQSVCEGSSVTLTASGNADSYAWNNSVQDGVAFTPSQSQSYVVTGTSALGCIQHDTVSVVLDSLPQVNAGANIAVCAGDSVTLTASGDANSYSWSDGVTDSQPFMPSSTNTYVLTGVGVNGCSNSDSTVVTVNSIPTVSAGQDTAICIGDEITLSGSGNAATYSWNHSVQDGVAFVPGSTQSYVVTGVSAAGCQAQDTINVMVNPLPGVNAGNDIIACAGDSVTVNATGDPASYTWSNGAENGTPFIASTSDTLLVTATDSIGCSSTDELLLTVNPLPDTTITVVNTFTLIATSNSLSYQWYKDGLPIDGATDSVYTATENGTYSVELTSDAGCGTMSESVTITSVGFETIQAEKFQLYPNPTAGELHVVVTSSMVGQNYALFDITGKLIERKGIPSKTFDVDMNNLPAGIYILRIKASTQRVVRR